MPRLSIIILTYNSSFHIENCLKGIFSYYEKELNNGDFEILLADNESTDNTLSEISAYFTKKYSRKININSNNTFINEHIHVIKNGGNLGFAKGMNTAVRHASGEYVLLINPDAIVQDNNIIKMLEYMDTKSDGAVCAGKIVDFNGHTELSSGTFYTPISILCFALGIENAIHIRYSPAQAQEVDYVSGGFMLLRKSYFDELNGFDEHFFMYVEDMELCYRIMKKGMKIYFYPYTVLKHVGQGSSNKEFAILNIYKGLLYFCSKHHKNYFFMVKLILRAKALLAVFIGTLINNDQLRRTYRKVLCIL